MALGVLVRIIKRPFLGALALGVAFSVFTFAVWLPNWRLVFQIASSSSVAFSDKLSLLWSLYGSIGTNFTAISASYTIIIAILFGINVALLTYYIKLHRGRILGAGTTAGAGGLISGMFGVGCAACGTFILSSILGLVGAAGIVTFLPLGGEEFGIIGVLLLVYATIALLRKIENPLACAIPADAQTHNNVL